MASTGAGQALSVRRNGGPSRLERYEVFQESRVRMQGVFYGYEIREGDGPGGDLVVSVERQWSEIHVLPSLWPCMNFVILSEAVRPSLNI